MEGGLGVLVDQGELGGMVQAAPATIDVKFT